MAQGNYFDIAGQPSLFDRFTSLSPVYQKRIQDGWAGSFRENILPLLIEAEGIFAPLFSGNSGSRPAVPAALLLGYLLIKDLFGYTDAKLQEEVECNIAVQYALGTTSLDRQMIHHNTLNRFRTANALYTQETGIDLMQVFFDQFAGRLKEIYIPHPGSSKRRMDSVMIHSGSKKMNRIELFHTCIANALFLLSEEEICIPDSLFHYLEDGDRNQIVYHQKGKSEDKLKQLALDALAVRDLFCDSFIDSEDYQLLNRLIGEQLELDESGQFVSVKDGKKLSSTILQNPSDPEATFRTKANAHHTGYVGNFAETCDEETGIHIIDSADLQPNIHSDSRFCKEEIQKMAQSEDHSILIADGAYGSDENFHLAAGNGIELITTDLAGKETPDLYAEFEIDEKHHQVLCPNGQSPDRCRKDLKTESWWVSYLNRKCQNCPCEDRCPLKKRKNVRSGKISRKQIDRARMQRKMSTAQFREYYRFRNGVEAIPSQLRRKQNIDCIPVMGRVRKKFWYLMDLTAINVRRILRYEQKAAKTASVQSAAESSRTGYVINDALFTTFTFLWKIQRNPVYQ